MSTYERIIFLVEARKLVLDRLMEAALILKRREIAMKKVVVYVKSKTKEKIVETTIEECNAALESFIEVVNRCYQFSWEIGFGCNDEPVLLESLFLHPIKKSMDEIIHASFIGDDEIAIFQNVIRDTGSLEYPKYGFYPEESLRHWLGYPLMPSGGKPWSDFWLKFRRNELKGQY